jgi:hypothetical protein
MQKIRKDKPTGVIIHTPCVTFFILNKLKCHVFCFVLFCFIFCLFSYKIREQECRTSPAQGKGLAPVGGGWFWGKGVGG